MMFTCSARGPGISSSLVRVEVGRSIVGSSPLKFQEAIAKFLWVESNLLVLNVNLFFMRENDADFIV